MIITILSSTVSTVPTAKGSYQVAEVAFKDAAGQVKGKKIMSFGAGANTFKVLSKAQTGESYEITAVKNEASGFWDWTNASKSNGNTATTGVVSQSTSSTSGATVRNSYETAEERARKQVYIVRQSSLANAVAFLADRTGDTEEVISVAKQFEAYVFSNEDKKVSEFVGDEDLIL